MIIERFGLNKEDIDRYNLTWIENLKTGSGREASDYAYIQKFGRRKCESNALFKNDETLRAGEEICRKAIEKYYGSDAKERFRRKEEASRGRLRHIYEDPLWRDFQERIDGLIESLAAKSENMEGGKKPESGVGEEVEVVVDNKYYGRCPKCGALFNYDGDDVGRLVRCRHCFLPIRLRMEEDQSNHDQRA